jgi:hypothetical protein
MVIGDSDKRVENLAEEAPALPAPHLHQRSLMSLYRTCRCPHAATLGLLNAAQMVILRKSIFIRPFGPFVPDVQYRESAVSYTDI